MVIEDSVPDDRSRVMILASTLRDLREDLQRLVVDGDKQLYDRITTRLDGMDRASELLAENVNRVPTLFDRITAQMKELVIEKFNGLNTLLQERAERNKDASAATRQANTDAFTYLKELASTLQHTSKIAIDKSEAGFKDQITALSTQLTTNKDTLSTQLNDVKDRISRLETSSLTMRESKAETHMTVGNIMGIIGGCLAALSLVITIGLGISTMTHSTASTINPAISADMKRIDDLIAQSIDRNHDTVSRIDALAARLNSLTPPIHGQPYVPPTTTP